MEDFAVLYGQPGTDIRETGPKKRNKSLKFLKDVKDYDLYYGSALHLPEWMTLPTDFWAYDMGGFYEVLEIRKALSKVSSPAIILSYVPFNGNKAQETVHIAVEDKLPFVLVYERSDKAKFLNKVRKYNPIGLCDDQYENCKYVVDRGFSAIHCTVKSSEGRDCEEHDYSTIVLATTTEKLVESLLH